MKNPSRVYDPGEKEIKPEREIVGVAAAVRKSTTDLQSRGLARWALPLAALVAIIGHYLVSTRQPADETRLYFWLLGLILVCGVVLAALPSIWMPRSHWIKDRCPIFAIAVLLLCVWELITSGFRLLPMPYFPGPAGVLQSMLNDRALLFDSTWHSLLLLLSGYALGAAIALVTGVCIGWSKRAHYWGMPLLKFVGPIPATAVGSPGTELEFAL